MLSNVYFITGIDTDIGKSFATGLMARFLCQQGRSVVTQKCVQTGHIGQISEDILTHRRLMEIEPLPEDFKGETCPYKFSFPASPYLSAKLENKIIDPKKITSATQQLLKRFDFVLLEGAGGLLVPLTAEELMIDYVQRCGYPLVLVTSGRLGSINHTLLTLEAAQHRQIPVAGIVYNHYPSVHEILERESLDLFRRYCTSFVEMPVVHFDNIPDINFSLFYS
ncbi:MAG: dethiobiotin synthase [Planctomycetaceae bacterium]|jgi:dethiobiotin synthetase|nr:dethiobiotin synthase [Planctomycetaceae bacterium]